MAWLRTGDNAATNPRLLRVYEDPEASTALVLEAFGFLVLCASLAAAHTTDYVVSYGTAVLVAREEAPRMLDVCVRAGLLTEETRDGERVWVIIDDPDFLHMRSREEIEWEKQRKRDNSNPELIIPVRLRDGDACRYCGCVVNWRDRKGVRGATYDHRVPKQGATVDTMVVACFGCNSSRKDDPVADLRVPLLPAPERPYFSSYTRDWIDKHDWAKANGYSITSRRGRTIPVGTVPDDRKAVVAAHQRPDTQSGNAPTTATQPPAGDRAHRTTEQRPDSTSGNAPTTATQQPTGERAASATRPPAGDRAPKNTPRPAPARNLPEQADPADEHYPASGSAGTGRDGSGRDGTGPRSVPAPQGEPSDLSSPRRKRGRRRRRPGTQSSPPQTGDSRG